MFAKSYATTIKNLTRSLLFWIAFAFVIFAVIQRAMSVNYSHYDVNLGELIPDTDPRYILTYKFYIKKILNAPRVWVMLYAVPVFSVISTVLVLTRDYSDGFYEIEKAGGIKTSSYFFGRLSALVSVNLVTSLLALFVPFHLYYFTRGGIDEFTTLWSYIGDSAVRLLRPYIFAVIPGIMVYIGLTYMFGSLFKSGFVGAVAGLGYTLMTYLFSMPLQFRMPKIYNNFISPIPWNLYSYWGYYDTEWFTKKICNPFTVSQLALCMGILLGTAIFCFTVSYICTRRRKI